MTSREEFERMALPLEKDIYFAALSLCRREADALDLVQATYLKAFVAFSKFAAGTNLKAWMFTILKNAYVDQCRARREEPVSFDFESELAEGPGASTLRPEESLPDELLAAFRSLSPAHQVLIQLADIEGLAYKEIAGVLGKPMGSVMSGLFNARARLRSALARKRESEG